MNILGIIFLIIGISEIVIVPKMLKGETKEYSKYPVATGTVCHMEDFIGDRWIVSFIDETGREVLGMDDMILTNTFFSNKYHIPKVGTKEKVYYWKYDGESNFSVNNQNIEYYIHFCNEDLYDLQKKSKRDARFSSIGLGTFLIICGILICAFR